MLNWMSCMSRQWGISLLEVLSSLTIIAIILAMATHLFFLASNNNKVNNAINQITGLVAVSERWKGLSTDFTNISVNELAKDGMLVNFPGFTQGGQNNSKILDMWGDSITIDASGTDGNRATIKVTFPSNGICQAVGKYIPGSDTTGCPAFSYEFPTE